MCIISGEVNEVSSTNIFVSQTNIPGQQFTVYSNTVQMGTNKGVMVLPFPKGDCKMIDLSNYPRLFDDLKKACPFPFISKSLGLSRGFDIQTDSLLEVSQVGSYKASIVPSINDFSRLDQNFPINADVTEFLKNNYSYVVCRLDKENEYHPFGYIHNSFNNGLFVPTMHYHKHTNGQSTADWDHSIFCINKKLECPFIKYRGPRDFSKCKGVRFTQQENPNDLQTIKFSKLPSIEDCKTLYRYTVDGYENNHDLFAF